MNAIRNAGIALFVLVATATFSTAQDQLIVYDKPLKSVLNKIDSVYHVTLVYEEKNIKDKTVHFADWKFFSGVEETLDNVLKPLDLRYNKINDRQYEIKKWEYFRKNPEEGWLALKELLKTYPTLDEWEQRKLAVKTNILEKLGLSPLPHLKSLNVVKANYRIHDDYSVENVALEILPGVYLAGSLYKPIETVGKCPAMLCPHGHFYNKEDPSIPNERGRYRPDQQIRCAMLARMGVIVFSYDMFAWGESALQTEKQDHKTGLALTMQTWGSMCVTDYLSSLDKVDKSRIGVTGASGGATQTILIAALDDRIKLSVPVVMVSSYFYGGCPCESGLPIHQLDDGLPTNNAEIAALFAPRPQLVISDGSDWTQNVPKIEFPYLQKIYNLYNQKKNIANVHFPDEQHDYGPSKRFAMYRFVAKQFGIEDGKLKNNSGIYDESKVTIEHATEMYVFGENGKLPDDAVHGRQAIIELFNARSNNLKLF